MGLFDIFRFNKNKRNNEVAFLRRHQDYWCRNSVFYENIINKISTDVALMKFVHTKISNDTTQNLEFSDLMKVLTISPNKLETPTVFWTNVVRKIIVNGLAVVVPSYKNGFITSINLVDNFINFENDKVTIQMNGQNEQVLNVDDVWIFENPKKNLTTQLNQITNLIDDNLKLLSNKVNYDQGGLNGFLKIDTIVAGEQMTNRVKQRIKEINETSSSNGIGFLQKGEEFQELNKPFMNASKDEMEFLKLQLYSAFGLNEQLFTCNYTEDMYRAYYSSVLIVYKNVITEEITRKYFTQTALTQGQRLNTYYDLTSMTSIKDLTEFMFKAKYTGVMNSNELRAQYFNLPAYEGGHVYETNMNAVQINADNTNKGGDNDED